MEGPERAAWPAGIAFPWTEVSTINADCLAADSGLPFSMPGTQPNAPVRSLYIHVPFCAHKCEYCAFYSQAAQAELVERYLSALISELESKAGDLRPATVFFGGGTPSLLTLRQFERLFRNMEGLGLLGAAEWTVECNPATIS